MNIFKEYLKLTKTALKNSDKILEGISNKISSGFKTLSPEKQLVISERMDKCLNCPFNSLNAKTSKEYIDVFGKPYETSRVDTHCSLCGCNCEFKTSSLSSDCGIKGSPAESKGYEIKWKKYE